MNTLEMEQKVAKLLVKARHVIALTGAGISVPSGIPDFRSETGLWARYDIMEYGTLHAFRADPYKVWRMFRSLAETVQSAQPNRAHLALAEMEEMGILKAVVTQNIDHLHSDAGSKVVYEFHGACDSFRCLACNRGYNHGEGESRKDSEGIPLCDCGYVLKPNIVLFGENIPEEAMKNSFREADAADVILVVGTSAQVAPASNLPAFVASRGGAVVEMNVSHTELSHMAGYRIIGDVEITLPSLLEHVRALRQA